MADEITVIYPPPLNVLVSFGDVPLTTWGTILGDISLQQDLQDELVLKADLTDVSTVSDNLALHASAPVDSVGLHNLKIDTFDRLTKTDGTPLRVKTAERLLLDTSNGVSPTTIGEMVWNANKGTAELRLPGDVTLQLGEELLLPVLNKTGAPLLDGKAVYVNGGQGNKATVALASALTPDLAKRTIGLMTEYVADNGQGRVCTQGTVNGLNTLAWAEGTPLYLDTIAGGLTATVPVKPSTSVYIGVVTYQHGTQGSIFVKVQFCPALEDLSTVEVTSPVLHSTLQWDSGIWKDTQTPSFGTETDYTQFEGDGTMVAHGDATCYKDISLSGTSLVAGGIAAPDAVLFINSNLLAYGFNGANTVERLYGSCEMQHDYEEGTDVEVHVHWAPTTANAGNVVWQVWISWANSGTVFSAPVLLTATPSAANGAWMSTYNSVGVLSGVGKIMNSQFVIQVFRDPTDIGDTYPNDAVLIQFGLHYKVNTIGSRERTTK